MRRLNPALRKDEIGLNEPADMVHIPLTNRGIKKVRLSAIPESLWSNHPDTATDAEGVLGLRQFSPRNTSLVIIQNRDEPSRFIMIPDRQLEAFCKSFLKRRGFGIVEPISDRERT
jgi:hypothetical protein